MKITGWRYGIVQHLNKNGNYFAIHKIFRNDDKVIWSQEPIKITTEEASEIHAEIAIMARDIQIHDVIVVNDAEIKK